MAQPRARRARRSPRSTPPTPSAPCSACSPPRSGWCRSSAWCAPRCVCVALNLLCAARRAVAVSARDAASAAPALAAAARDAACWLLLARDRAARHRLRGAGGARAEPGGREHGLHVRDAAGGVPRRHRARRRRRTSAGCAARRAPTRCAIGCWSRWPRPACSARASLWARRAATRRCVLHALGAEHARRARRRGRAGACGGVPAAHARDGRAVQPPRHAAPARPASASGARSASTRWAPRLAPLLFGVLLVPRARAEVRAAARRAGYLAAVVAARLAHAQRLGRAAAALALALLGAAADVRRRSRRRPHRQLPGRRRWPRSASSKTLTASRACTSTTGSRKAAAPPVRRRPQALLPLLLHPAPRRALFLGLGTGVTAHPRPQDPTLAGRRGRAAARGDRGIRATSRAPSARRANPRLHLMAADARRFVRASAERYDLIVSDNFHPARSGSGSLYTVEHFEAVRGRLARAACSASGCPCTSSISTRCAASCAVLHHRLSARLGDARHQQPGHAGARARRRAPTATASTSTQLRARLARRSCDAAPPSFGIADEFALLGSFVAGPARARALRRRRPAQHRRPPGGRLSRAAHHLRARFAAARSADRPAARTRRSRPTSSIAEPTTAPGHARLAAYWAARNRFIEAGRDVQPTPDVRRMLAQVREPLLAVLRISPDFRPAYDPLLRMANALARSDPRRRAAIARRAGAPPARATRSSAGAAQ